MILNKLSKCFLFFIKPCKLKNSQKPMLENHMRHFFCFFAVFVFLLTSLPLSASQRAQPHVKKDSNEKISKTKIEDVDVVLYIRPSCSFCKKVLFSLDSLGIDVEIIDVSKDPKALAELIAIGGKSQVPCIVIDGKAMYESQSIIEWFKSKKSAESKTSM